MCDERMLCDGMSLCEALLQSNVRTLYSSSSWRLLYMGIPAAVVQVIQYL